MSRELHRRMRSALLATVTAAGMVAVAAAFDERGGRSAPAQGAAPPLFRNGARVPTEIVPPGDSTPPASGRPVTDARAPVQPTAQQNDAGAGDGVEDDAPGDVEPQAPGSDSRPRIGGAGDRERRDRRDVRYPRYRAYRRWSHGYARRATQDAYWAGRADAILDVQRQFNEADTDRRRDRLLTAHAAALERGLGLLATGEYRAAATALTLAARLDEGDPACRIHLAQAWLALGQHDAAGKALRRGLELQPELALMPLKLAKHYAAPTELDAHVARLDAAVQAGEAGRDGVFLLGFLQYQRGRMEAAQQCFTRIADGKRRDLLVRTLIDVTRAAK